MTPEEHALLTIECYKLQFTEAKIQKLLSDAWRNMCNEEHRKADKIVQKWLAEQREKSLK